MIPVGMEKQPRMMPVQGEDSEARSCITIKPQKVYSDIFKTRRGGTKALSKVTNKLRSCQTP